MSDRIPISIVTGFLGSGKTTLIAALLEQPAMQGAAVVVNEFGAVGIDDAVFAQTLDAGDVVLLANGCLCCAAGDDLGSTIWALARRSVPPRRIVIETSGLAEPAPLIRRLMADPRLKQSTRLDAIVATIDAVDGLKNLDEQAVALRQCAVADRRLVTKVDLVDAPRVAALSERLFALNRGASVAEVSRGAIDASVLFGAALYDERRGRSDLERWLNLDGYRAGEPHRSQGVDIRFSCDEAPDNAVRAWLLEEFLPVDWETLSPRLGEIVSRHGDKLLRLKGVIWTHGDARPLVVHGVQRVFHAPARLHRWTGPPSTSMVIIGDRGANEAVESIANALAEAAFPSRSDLNTGSPRSQALKHTGSVSHEDWLDRCRTDGRADGREAPKGSLSGFHLEPDTRQG
jgi:G3E family GTPase